MDISAGSIDYARQHARRSSLDITYIRQDYLTLDQENRWDLILMISTDIVVLFPGQRKDLIQRIFRALKPGGTFIFDVINTRWQQNQVPSRSWEVSPGGFWRDRPYLSL